MPPTRRRLRARIPGEVAIEVGGIRHAADRNRRLGLKRAPTRTGGLGGGERSRKIGNGVKPDRR